MHRVWLGSPQIAEDFEVAAQGSFSRGLKDGLGEGGPSPSANVRPPSGIFQRVVRRLGSGSRKMLARLGGGGSRGQEAYGMQREVPWLTSPSERRNSSSCGGRSDRASRASSCGVSTAIIPACGYFMLQSIMMHAMFNVCGAHPDAFVVPQALSLPLPWPQPPTLPGCLCLNFMASLLACLPFQIPSRFFCFC